MVYVALLRGINVGGKNKVEMKKLKATFESAGMTDVTTYINSGNVVFKSTARKAAELAATLEKAIERDFGLAIKVLLRNLTSMKRLDQALPANWTNDSQMRCDVLFLWKEFDNPSVVKVLPAKPELDEVMYVPGAIIWRVDRANVTRSGMPRLIGSALYKGMTIRNCTTARKLTAIMEALA
ncbi:MAG: DUF1697 domain-containing protein [Acidimicrobiia bacterium]